MKSDFDTLDALLDEVALRLSRMEDDEYRNLVEVWASHGSRHVLQFVKDVNAEWVIG